MSKRYRHIKEYEKEILELRAQGKTRREICERYGFSLKQLQNFITRYNRCQKKKTDKICIKESNSTEAAETTNGESVADLHRKLNQKNARIKQLEMENELMRDFLLLIERK